MAKEVIATETRYYIAQYEGGLLIARTGASATKEDARTLARNIALDILAHSANPVTHLVMEEEVEIVTRQEVTASMPLDWWA